MRGLNADSTVALWKLRGCTVLRRRGRGLERWEKMSGENENIGKAGTSIRIRGKREQKGQLKPNTLICNINSPLFQEGCNRT